MKLSTRTRYGLRALISLALKKEGEPVYLGDIAKEHDMSLKYLDHLFTRLKKAGIIKNRKAKHGGYVLGRPADKIFAYEIVDALEGRLSLLDCSDDPECCERSSECAPHLLWKGTKEAIKKSLSITLSDIAGMQSKMNRIGGHK